MQLSVSDIKAELCKRKFSYFVKEFWEIIIQDELVWNWHMEVLCDEIQMVYERVIGIIRPVVRDGKPVMENNKPVMERVRLPKLYDLIVNIPPGTTKSTICTVMAPAWSWTRDESLRHITGSYSYNLSTEHAVKSRDIIKSDKYRLYFPNVVIKPDEDNKTDYKTTNGGQRYATSTTGSLTGTHGHIITMDDPINPKQAASDAELETANTFFSSTLPTRKVDKAVTPIILIMQRLAINDPTGYLLAKGKDNVRKVCLPSTLSKNVSPREYKESYIDGLLDPVRLNKHILNEMKIDLGSSEYAAQFDQDPVPPGGIILKRDWFQIVDRPIPPDSIRRFQLDTAYTKDQTNDPTGIIHYYREDNDIFITGAESNWFEFPELIKWLPAYVRNNGYQDNKSMVRVEPKASGKSVVQQLSKETDLNIVESENPDKDKIVRTKTASPKIEAGRVKLHRGAWNESFITQCCSFPKAPHDDELDCLTEIVRNELIKPEFYIPI